MIPQNLPAKANPLLPFLSLFTSMGTLVCCALPALFVALGAGAAFAGLLTRVPSLIWLSENKLWLFGVGAAFLTFGGIGIYRARNLPCPLDPRQADACSRARRFSARVYFTSLAIYLLGAGFAFLPAILG